jgi:hypothetical protein
MNQSIIKNYLNSVRGEEQTYFSLRLEPHERLKKTKKYINFLILSSYGSRRFSLQNPLREYSGPGATIIPSAELSVSRHEWDIKF